MAISHQAVGTLQRRGLCALVERDDLISVGCLALVERKPTDEALAVKIAHDAMVDEIRSAMRWRELVEPLPDDAREDEEDEKSDAVDIAIYKKESPSPSAKYCDLWEAKKALPPQQYQAIVLTYWGRLSQTEIAAEMGLSQQRVGQILKDAKINIGSALVKRVSQTVNLLEGAFLEAAPPPNQQGWRFRERMAVSLAPTATAYPELLVMRETADVPAQMDPASRDRLARQARGAVLHNFWSDIRSTSSAAILQCASTGTSHLGYMESAAHNRWMIALGINARIGPEYHDPEPVKRPHTHGLRWIPADAKPKANYWY